MHFEIHGTASKVRDAVLALKLPDAPVQVRHAFPLPKGYYFGPLSGPMQSISGMAADRSDRKWRPSIVRIQQLVHVRSDGMYGPLTINAVKGWQAGHHLVADGLTGPITWRAMRL
jgi:peptidoglycan hydrolase-like protein with peptidoglycan-binding domain